MNRLEIFQEVYGKNYMFTETELSRLHQVAELIVRECEQYVAKHWDENVGEYFAEKESGQ